MWKKLWKRLWSSVLKYFAEKAKIWRLKRRLRHYECETYDLACQEIDRMEHESVAMKKTLIDIIEICQEFHAMHDAEVLSNQLLGIKNLAQLTLDMLEDESDGCDWA